MSTCNQHGEIMQIINSSIENINRKIEKTDKKLDKIDDKLDKLIEVKTSIKYIEKDFEEHKKNNMIHISKFWAAASVIAMIVGMILKIKGL